MSLDVGAEVEVTDPHIPGEEGSPPVDAIRGAAGHVRQEQRGRRVGRSDAVLQEPIGRPPTHVLGRGHVGHDPGQRFVHHLTLDLQPAHIRGDLTLDAPHTEVGDDPFSRDDAAGVVLSENLDQPQVRGVGDAVGNG